MTTNNETKKQALLPVLPLRDMVVFPGSISPVFAGRPMSLAALNATGEDKTIVILTQRKPEVNDPKESDLYQVGVVGRIRQSIKHDDGTVKVLISALYRVRVHWLDFSKDYISAMVEPMVTVQPEKTVESDAWMSALVTGVTNYCAINPSMPKNLAQTLRSKTSLEEAVDLVCMHLTDIDATKRQELLEETNLVMRCEKVLARITELMDKMQIEEKIQRRVKKQMDKNQREYFLNEQIKAIHKELGRGEEENAADIDQYAEKIANSGMSEEAREKCEGELKKLRMMPAMSAEATVVRGYLDALLALPWTKKSRVSKNIKEASDILEADHYGLEKVKERILEYLAVQSRVDKLKAPILCLVGAPGVGKTSLGQSIARATNRKFVRMALGGVRDEAEIRGHRRTYVGSMPGKIIQSITKAGVRNPLFLLDEVDKMGMDSRGDPASALLEVLDPEQNNTFQDHYIEVDYDLSDVMFVATSNSLNIPQALLDRMEVIYLSGYTEDEKLNIAKRHLIPKQVKMNGLKTDEIDITDEAVLEIIRYYTREAGVRGLEREISKICRKVVKNALIAADAAPKKRGRKKIEAVRVDATNIGEYLGVKRYSIGLAQKEPQIGQVNGLAWTEVGGDLLTIEAAVFPGKGQVQRTGSLGDVMKESVEAARSVVRARAESLGLDSDIFGKTDWHLHFPEGATPKDGPSAGGAITTAMVSALTKIPVRPDVAMTGEITLHGEILEIGGLKEKLLATLRAGVKTVLIPKDNVKDLQEIPDNVKNNLEIIPVKWIDEILPIALVKNPMERFVDLKDEISSSVTQAPQMGSQPASKA